MFPSMTLAVDVPARWIPASRFPEMTLPGPVPGAAVSPPTVVPEALSISTPLCTLPTPEEVPVASRPIEFPRTWLLSALLGGRPESIRDPHTRPEVAGDDVAGPGVVPPTTLPAALSTIPSPRLGTVAIPLPDRPIRFPRTRLPVVVSRISMPL